MDNVTVYMETAYNSSNSMNSTRNLNKNRKKSIVCCLGDVIDVYYAQGDDGTPLHSHENRYTSFSGFRIALQ